ncbi:MAG: hypothetical protein LBG76_07900 [Treponema sp.]|nr:hypothetical protein [Treponema sp.]
MQKMLMGAIIALVSMACASGPKTGPSGVVEETSEYVVINHQAKDFGGSVPEWVSLYATEGITAVESLDQYKDKYVFIGTDTGKNINALRQWSKNFTAAQEMAVMMTRKVEAKFAGAAVGSPEEAYGSYFESVVKNVSGATFSGARTEADYWILRRYNADQREEYTYYVLITIDRKLLDQQVIGIINGVKADKPLTREQETAVDRVKEAFYEGF